MAQLTSTRKRKPLANSDVSVSFQGSIDGGKFINLYLTDIREDETRETFYLCFNYNELQMIMKRCNEYMEKYPNDKA